MTGVKILLEVEYELAAYKQTDINDELEDKGGEINILDSEITIHNYHF